MKTVELRENGIKGRYTIRTVKNYFDGMQNDADVVILEINPENIEHYKELVPWLKARNKELKLSVDGQIVWSNKKE